MEKTAESYRIALESEISRWNGFARALRKDDREAFEEMMDMGRNNAMAAGNACRPILFEPMVMSILLFQQKRIKEVEQEIGEVQHDKSNPDASHNSESTSFPKDQGVRAT